LAADPRLLLLDEPLSALDAALQAQMQHELIALQQQVKVAFVYVTHDQVHALALSQRIAVMQAGRVVQIDKPEIIYRQPMTRFVAGFIGACNLLDGTVERAADGCLQVRVDGLGALRVNSAEPLVAGSRGTVAIRPEQIRLQRGQIKAADDQSSSWPGVIRDRLYQGDVTLYTVELASGPRLQTMVANAATAEAGQFQQGDPVGLTWPETAGVFLCH